jgi:hypothetical protein
MFETFYIFADHGFFKTAPTWLVSFVLPLNPHLFWYNLFRKKQKIHLVGLYKLKVRLKAESKSTAFYVKGAYCKIAFGVAFG